MQDFVPLKFTSFRAEEDVRILCAGCQIPFETLEPAMNGMYILVPPGSKNLPHPEIGHERFMENPSERLDKACRDFLLKASEPRRRANIEERRRLTAAGIPDPLAEFEAKWRKEMGFDVFDEIDEWLTGLRREGLPPSAKRELAKLDPRSKVKRQLRVVK